MEERTQDHPEIPVGLYCYNGWHKGEDGKMHQGKVCPHWQKTENGARCNLLNEEHHTYCCFHLVWDQVKECHINEGCDYEPVRQTDEDLKKEGFELKSITCRCGKDMEIWEKRRNK